MSYGDYVLSYGEMGTVVEIDPSNFMLFASPPVLVNFPGRKNSYCNVEARYLAPAATRETVSKWCAGS